LVLIKGRGKSSIKDNKVIEEENWVWQTKKYIDKRRDQVYIFMVFKIVKAENFPPFSVVHMKQKLIWK
jgi:hypothetical protein